MADRLTDSTDSDSPTPNPFTQPPQTTKFHSAIYIIAVIMEDLDNDTPPLQQKIKGKRGRPRLQRSLQSQTERRRAQVRDAQRTYRLKKESAINDLEKRVTSLQSAVSSMETLFRDLYEAGIEIAVRESNNNLMQIFAQAGMKFELLMSMIEAESPDYAEGNSPSTSATTSSPHQAPKWSPTNITNPLSRSMTSKTSSNVGNESAFNQSLPRDDSAPSPLVNPNSGFLDGFPQDLIPDPKQTSQRRESSKNQDQAYGAAGNTSASSMSTMYKHLDKLAIGQNQQDLPPWQPSNNTHLKIPTSLNPPENQPLEPRWGYESNQSFAGSSQVPATNSALNIPSELALHEAKLQQSNNFQLPSLGGQDANQSMKEISKDPLVPNSHEYYREVLLPLFTQNSDGTPLSRAQLQNSARILLKNIRKPAISDDKAHNTISELIFRQCLVNILEYYVTDRFKTLQRVFSNQFLKEEKYLIGRMIAGLRLDTTYNNSTWSGRVDDDSLFPGYASPGSVEEYFNAAENAGAKLDKEKFIKLVSAHSFSMGGMPRISYTDIQSAIVLSTMF